jgi:hypothetical protein
MKWHFAAKKGGLAAWFFVKKVGRKSVPDFNQIHWPVVEH